MYRKAYVFCNPTFDDNYPTTNIEALCSGTPVITFNTGGSPEMLNEKNGIITREKNADSILSVLEKVNDLYKNFQFDRDKFSKETFVLELLRIYDKILK